MQTFPRACTNLPALSFPAPGVQDNGAMDQYTLGLGLLPRKTRKEVFLDKMYQVVRCAVLMTLIAPFARGAHQAMDGRSPFPIETMLLIYCLPL